MPDFYRIYLEVSVVRNKVHPSTEWPQLYEKKWEFELKCINDNLAFLGCFILFNERLQSNQFRITFWTKPISNQSSRLFPCKNLFVTSQHYKHYKKVRIMFKVNNTEIERLVSLLFTLNIFQTSQLTFTFSKSTIETLEKGLKYVQI